MIGRWGRRVIALALCALLLASHTAFAQSADKAPQAKPTPRPAAQPPASKPAAKPSPEFDKIVQAATEARQAERWEEAIALYKKAVQLKPDYVEGFWYQGHGLLRARQPSAVPRRSSGRRSGWRRRTAPSMRSSACANSD